MERRFEGLEELDCRYITPTKKLQCSRNPAHGGMEHAQDERCGRTKLRLLLVEDDVEMASALTTALLQNGLVVDHVSCLKEAIEAASWDVYDILLLDRQLPDGDSLECLASFRIARPDIPMIILTAHNELTDRIAGLDGGADDYIGKPFSLAELMARIRALMRRPAQLITGQRRYENLAFDHQALQAFVDDIPLELPRRELLVLQALVRRFGKTVVRSSLEEAVYGFDETIQSNALDSHISRLRRRLTEADARVTIHSIRGVGYLMKAST